MTTYHGIAYRPRGPGRRSRHSSRRRDDRPGRAGKPRTGRRAAGAQVVRKRGVHNAHAAETDALPPARRGALESWVRGKLACPVRRGADGKGPGTRYLASGLPDFAAERRGRPLRLGNTPSLALGRLRRHGALRWAPLGVNRDTPPISAMVSPAERRGTVSPVDGAWRAGTDQPAPAEASPRSRSPAQAWQSVASPARRGSTSVHDGEVWSPWRHASSPATADPSHPQRRTSRPARGATPCGRRGVLSPRDGRAPGAGSAPRSRGRAAGGVRLPFVNRVWGAGQAAVPSRFVGSGAQHRKLGTAHGSSRAPPSRLPARPGHCTIANQQSHPARRCATTRPTEEVWPPESGGGPSRGPMNN